MAVNVIPFRFPGIPAVRCAFQTRQGGTDKDAAGPEYCGGNISYDVGDNAEHVTANRRMLHRQLGFDRWVELRQVHGDVLVTDSRPVTAVDERPRTEADGHTTDRPGDALIIKTADCQPILLAHTSGRYIAALHAGWRGNRAGFIGSAVARFCCRYGISPADVMAVRGPSLGPAAAQFVNFDTEWGPAWQHWFHKEHMTMDLWSLTRHQLHEAGLPREQIFTLDLCTWSLPDMFFSYRRAKASGRQAAFIWIER
ncbi:polyphenol oxidase family protein [Oleidesulfovibrio alaskensis]|jgi:hypothetical protein|uniref:polyphenol oxidase family protein n=1 Tax=Oleidesulfovibrio alaskensis TaxID=58180 RepID=UPI001A52D193|nr:polyphenol oxidase family protein [Oleidesulfovibrio alaskensis]MBL3581895.1 laccase domain-containing protein [Oleidesulfovibrio alaskensis]